MRVSVGTYDSSVIAVGAFSGERSTVNAAIEAAGTATDFPADDQKDGGTAFYFGSFFKKCLSRSSNSRALILVPPHNPREKGSQPPNSLLPPVRLYELLLSLC